jgi:hypothetical protein
VTRPFAFLRVIFYAHHDPQGDAMPLTQYLPTKKVTAFVLGGALTIVAFWFLIDVLGALEDWPEAWVLGSFVLIVGAVVAWIVPESAWARLQGHLSGEVATPAGPVAVEGKVTLTPPPDDGNASLDLVVSILLIIILVLVILRLA